MSSADPARLHARNLLQSLTPPAGGVELPPSEPVSAAVDWARSGAMALTGRADGPALAAPGAPASAVRGALLVLEGLVGAGGAEPADDWPGVELLGERAALAGLHRQGPRSPGGHYRPLRTADGWWGISLARPDDLELLPALVQATVGDDPWEALESWSQDLPASSVVERAQLLGLPAGRIDVAREHRDEQLRFRHPGVLQPWLLHTGPEQRARERPVVVDLTSLWAGPLCAHLLGLAGARVVKVESIGRPDGARRGDSVFFDLLHAGHESVALDLTVESGRRALARLVSWADVVLESSRPRALEQLGIDAATVVASGTTWIALTAYGRTGPWSNRVGFGDDVAAAAGLVVMDEGLPMPCGDALADPLAGVHAAVAATAALQSGRAHLVDVAMRDVAAVASLLPSDDARGRVEAAPPVARVPRDRGPRLGEHTASVLRELR